MIPKTSLEGSFFSVRVLGCAVWEHGTEGMLVLLCKIVSKPRLAGCSDKGKGSSAYVSWCANKGMGWSGEVNEMINASAGWAISQPNKLWYYIT